MVIDLLRSTGDVGLFGEHFWRRLFDLGQRLDSGTTLRLRLQRQLEFKFAGACVWCDQCTPCLILKQQIQGDSLSSQHALQWRKLTSADLLAQSLNGLHTTRGIDVIDAE
ncbi:hypothetical protein EGI20_14490 [Aquitalea sp. S1-19]|nr:hypothetical protein [Aquitalea sp. S1-19]